jgi:hypothetical protein
MSWSAVLVRRAMAQPHGGVLGQGPGMQGVEGVLGLLPEDGAAEALPDPLADALEVAGGDRLGRSGPRGPGGLAVEVVVAKGCVGVVGSASKMRRASGG